MPDAGHIETEIKLRELEDKISREYAKAAREVEEKWKRYLEKSEKKDKEMRAKMDAGEITKQQYHEYRLHSIADGKRWRDMRDTLAKDCANASDIAKNLVDEYKPEIYAINYNFGTYEIESGSGIDTSFTLYDHETVERLMREDPQLLPDPSEEVSEKIRRGELERWERQKITSVVTQGILQGESIPDLAKRMRRVVGMNKAASIRNARTAMTNAQSSGRYDSYRRADAMGIKFKVVWIATLDNRTRHTHRLLDGQMQAFDVPFDVDGIKIKYPADYGGKDYKVPGDMIYNCRCTIGAVVKGSDAYEANDINVDQRRNRLGNMSYEEWKRSKPKQEEKRPASTVKRFSTGRR